MKLAIVAALTCLVGSASAGLSSEAMLKLAKALKRGIIALDDSNYRSILEGPRDYHLIALLTLTAPQFNCILCNEFKPEFDLVAGSWMQDHPDGYKEPSVKELVDEEAEEEEAGSDERSIEHAIKSVPKRQVFFLLSEYLMNKKLFEEFKLNSIPKVYYFGPLESEKPKNYLTELHEYLFYQGDQKDILMAWMTAFTGHQFNIHVPPDYSKIVMNVGGVIAAVALLYKHWGLFLQLASLRGLWRLLSLIAILLFTLGYMFNQIRGVPYLREMGPDKVEYFQPTQQAQYGVETQIVLFLYGCLLLAVVVLVTKLPTVINKKVQLLSVLIFLAVIFSLYLGLILIFKIKSLGYPYTLLHFM